MFRLANVLLVAVLAAPGVVAQASGKFDNIGRIATPAEVQRWDIDVRPDFLTQGH